MKNGNWIPISKAFLKHLPHDRAYTKLEAVFSMQSDYDGNRPVSLTGYSNLWQWSKNKIRKFFDDVGVEIAYPEDTRKRQNQKGLIRVLIRDRSGTDKGLISFMDNKDLQSKKDRSGTDKGLIKDRSGYTTIQTNTNTKYKVESLEYRLGKLLFSLMKERNEKYEEPDLQGWAVHIDRMMRIDKHTEKEIAKVIRWCQADEFWCNNILSTQKLREKFPKLWEKASGIKPLSTAPVYEQKPIEDVIS